MSLANSVGPEGGWGWRSGEYGFHSPSGWASGVVGLLLKVLVLFIWAVVWLVVGWFVAGKIVFGKLLHSHDKRLTLWDAPILVVCAFILSYVFLLFVVGSLSMASFVAIGGHLRSLPLWAQAAVLGAYWASVLVVGEYNRVGDPPPAVVRGRNPEFLRFVRAALWPPVLVAGLAMCFGFFLVRDLTTFVIYVSALTLIWLPLVRAIHWVNGKGNGRRRRRDAVVAVSALASLAVAIVTYNLGEPKTSTPSEGNTAWVAPPTPSTQFPSPSSASFEWVGFENSSVRDREKELRGQVGGLFRRVVAEGNFVDLCRSVGGECIQVRDWEGRNFPCNAGSILHDGTRLALCRFPRQ